MLVSGRVFPNHCIFVQVVIWASLEFVGHLQSRDLEIVLCAGAPMAWLAKQTLQKWWAVGCICHYYRVFESNHHFLGDFLPGCCWDWHMWAAMPLCWNWKRMWQQQQPLGRRTRPMLHDQWNAFVVKLFMFFICWDMTLVLWIFGGLFWPEWEWDLHTDSSLLRQLSWPILKICIL